MPQRRLNPRSSVCGILRGTREAGRRQARNCYESLLPPGYFEPSPGFHPPLWPPGHGASFRSTLPCGLHRDLKYWMSQGGGPAGTTQQIAVLLMPPVPLVPLVPLVPQHTADAADAASAAACR